VIAMIATVAGIERLAAAPLNDNLADATPIFGLTNLIASNVGSTAEPGEPFHGFEPPESTIWWKWTVPFTATFNFITSNSVNTGGTPLDTVIAVYTGNSFSNLATVVSNDDTEVGEFGALWSRCVLRAYAGERLMIAAGSLGAVGSIRLSINLTDRFMFPWQAQGLNGEVVQSSSFSGQFMMIDFWETTCSACIEELPALIKIQDQFAPRGFTIVGLSGDPSITLVEDYLDGRGINYPIAMSTPAIQLNMSGGAVGYPTKYLVDPDNRMVGSFTGGGNEKTYRGLLNPLLREDPRLRAAITRANGIVTIRWPARETGYSVESSSAPKGNSWNDTGLTPVLTNGEFIVNIPAGGDAGYFRLKKP
jgi:thiol-disulfide isomerase/thioredoxin